MEQNEEKMLVKRARSGDRQALSLLWDALTPKLFGYLVNTTKNKPLAEDLLQTTWLKAIDNLSKFKQQDAGFSAWLFAIARNEYRQHWRKRKNEVSFEPAEHDQPDSSQGSPEAKIFVEQALAYLSDDDRELIRLRYIVDLPIKDIALILKLNFVTVRVRIHRALAKMRAAITS
ncbi:MAG: RNA polymerase sigma factor [Candidatus Yanofskybacteria bacterium]|nr:RNA polymerase sigma factor [Candidatus Yanofskybacteria bacterium]